VGFLRQTDSAHYLRRYFHVLDAVSVEMLALGPRLTIQQDGREAYGEPRPDVPVADRLVRRRIGPGELGHERERVQRPRQEGRECDRPELGQAGFQA
jgi:hypothetical protein